MEKTKLRISIRFLKREVKDENKQIMTVMNVMLTIFYVRFRPDIKQNHFLGLCCTFMDVLLSAPRTMYVK